MKLSINESYFRSAPHGARSQEESLRCVRAAGFDTVDIGMFSLTTDIPQTENHLGASRKLRDYCDSLGLKVNQSHVPFYENEPMPDGFVPALVRCVECSAVLGASQVVVHGDTWYQPEQGWNHKAVLQTVHDVYAPVVDMAEKLGIRIAFETLYEFYGSPEHRTRFCSYTEEVDDLVSSFHSDAVGVCWDFGHVRMSYGDEMYSVMKRIKSKLIATHVHDNTGRYDQHSLPYCGSTDWSLAMRTLAEVGYEGDLTLELAHGAIPDHLLPDYLAYVRKAGETLVAQFEAFRAKL